ncbi:S8 family serine peptidase [Yoonia vestfoldensis]|uniref:S8 family serine peptidase n=1 Tax=Yoonia vestfoldensis TaxID=245188 RepID=UPI000375255C|nr:S8 family serine peptidase [Yoonia vestfoldensis]
MPPKNDPEDEADINRSRRKLLGRIGLGMGFAYVAPALTGLSVARASGGSGGGSPASGPSSSSRSTPSRASAPSRASMPSRPDAQPVQQQPIQQRRPSSPTGEILVFVPFGQSLSPALAAGFRPLSQTDAGALSGILVRFAVPSGRTVRNAQAELERLFPDAVTDENHFYTPDDFTCTGEDCAAHAMIGWAGWPSAMRPRIGMIDTGVNTAHPALQGRRLKVYQVDLGDREAAGRVHGTAIAAMLVGSVTGRVPGLLPDAELIAVEAFHARGSGEQADAFSVANAVDLLISQGVDVINMSFSGPENAVLKRVVERAAELDIGLVAAAGNGGPGSAPAYPAAWQEVIAVTAVDARERIYRQANQGPYVALAAPGVDIWTAASISGGRLRSGTSYATPFVTAALAVERMRMPEKQLRDVTATLFACAKDLGEAGYDPVYGHGLVSSPETCNDETQFFSVSGE